MSLRNHRKYQKQNYRQTKSTQRIVIQQRMESTNKILIQLYESLMRSVIDYPCFISVSCKRGIMDKLEILQNHALRIVLKKRQVDHVTIDSLREEANVSTIEKRIQKLLL